MELSFDIGTHNILKKKQYRFGINPIKALLLQPFLEFRSIHEEHVTSPNKFHHPRNKDEWYLLYSS